MYLIIREHHIWVVLSMNLSNNTLWNPFLSCLSVKNMAAMQSATDLFLICTELENTAPKRVKQSAKQMLQKQHHFKDMHTAYYYRHLQVC